MQITNSPTNLDIYYCENCHGIVASTDLEQLNPQLITACPFCSEDALVLLPKEDYQQNFNPNLFPSPQNIILKNFFDTADNALNLLNRFAVTDPMSLLREQFAELASFKDVHLLVSSQIELTLRVDIDGLENIEIRADGTDLTENLPQIT
ncbi:MAG: hypothetical protein AB4063_12480 [Crocosphaera sp.]